jgi:hypothetical protein
MTNESETKKGDSQQQKQQQGKHDPAGSVTNASQENQSQGNRPQDISKKSPSQDNDPQPRGQEKLEDERRRAS